MHTDADAEAEGCVPLISSRAVQFISPYLPNDVSLLGQRRRAQQ